jgi:hypothetical protein
MLSDFILIIIIYHYCNKRNKRNKRNKSKLYGGYVYVISNAAFKSNIYKIGATERLDYRDRVRELNSATGVPLNFKVVAVFKCHEPLETERLTHISLQKKRLNTRREFFKVRLFIVRRVIKKYGGVLI